ncbi:uncharacterized protein GGS25DRAFT_292713 [Hypoxylon fragiforme]|uniref:uncharacterized protein n=1 Tax=Hypoxylon fragiforme TaxID=63214 RepID=UPI0020C662BB|nr:uncharacterized protein GGS25DRAFT_292713 [Hypoxylon fragiforme]KAI2608827.1 hypothetical protein GGS25DRAFT_292713 [Hypoxylon fragiforme]
MPHEEKPHRHLGSIRRARSKTRKHHSSNSGGVVLRVLDSFRSSRRNDEKKVASLPPVQLSQQGDWQANYQVTHRPDRPLVDKRSKEPLPDSAYAAELLRMQDKNREQYTGHNGRDLDKTAPPRTGPPAEVTPLPASMLNTAPVRNFSYSVQSPKGTRDSLPTPSLPLAAPEWLPRDNITQEKGKAVQWQDHARARHPSTPPSPKAVTIQVYHKESADHGPAGRGSVTHGSVNHGSVDSGSIDRGPIVRRATAIAAAAAAEKEEEREGPSNLPRKISESDHQAKVERRHSWRVRHERRGISVNPKDVSRKSRTPSYGDPGAVRPGLILNSSPTLSTYSSTEHETTSTSEAAIRTCPWPGCNTVLTTTKERTDNICASCHDALYPRESAFFGTHDITRPQSPKEDDVNALRTLVSIKNHSYSNDNGNNKETSNTKAPERPNRSGSRVPRRVDSGYSMDDFKLEPAPRGKRLERMEKRSPLVSPPPNRTDIRNNRSGYVGGGDSRSSSRRSSPPRKISTDYSPHDNSRTHISSNDNSNNNNNTHNEDITPTPQIQTNPIEENNTTTTTNPPSDPTQEGEEVSFRKAHWVSPLQDTLIITGPPPRREDGDSYSPHTRRPRSSHSSWESDSLSSSGSDASMFACRSRRSYSSGSRTPSPHSQPLRTEDNNKKKNKWTGKDVIAHAATPSTSAASPTSFSPQPYSPGDIHRNSSTQNHRHSTAAHRRSQNHSRSHHHKHHDSIKENPTPHSPHPHPHHKKSSAKRKSRHSTTKTGPPPPPSPSTTTTTSASEPAPPPPRHASRRQTTVMHDLIDEIIDCYTKLDDISVEDQERRKASVVGTYMEEPEEERMMRLGYF